MLDTTTYYVPENKDVLSYFAEKNIKLSDSMRGQLSFISRKTNNNYIGYYQFKIDGQYIKFFVVPKIHKGLTDLEKERAFVDFLSKYYQLATKYPEIRGQKIDGNIKNISFDSFYEKTGRVIDDFIRYKYEYALTVLDRFFRKHNKTQYKTTAFASQSINHKIDLKNNIRSLNKANVHQIKKELEAYSEVALISEQALKRFKTEKIQHIEHHQDVLLSKTNTILNHIKKKYKPQGNFSFKDRDIITNRIAKLFKGNRELKEVYEALLIIIGLEHFDSQDTQQEAQKLENMVALFFNPADLFEWMVYDKLKKAYSENAVIQKDKLGNGTSKEYELKTLTRSIIRTSEPDFIVIDNDIVSIIDAKWKVLTKIEDIKFEDIAKLERDWVLRKDDFGKTVTAMLIYPKIDFDFDRVNPLTHSYSAGFEFCVEKC
jgi:hypothetical protein